MKKPHRGPVRIQVCIDMAKTIVNTLDEEGLSIPEMAEVVSRLQQGLTRSVLDLMREKGLVP